MYLVKKIKTNKSTAFLNENMFHEYADKKGSFR